MADAAWCRTVRRLRPLLGGAAPGLHSLRGADELLGLGTERDLRAGKSQTLLVRRQRCKPCATSHAVLPSFMAQGRLDAIGVIGAALEAMVAQPGTGAGVARAIDVPEAVTVLDAYAVIAFLRAEPAAGEVRPLLDNGDATLTAVGVAEVLDHLVRLAGADEEDAVLDLAQLGLLEGIAVRLRSRPRSRTVTSPPLPPQPLRGRHGRLHRRRSGPSGSNEPRYQRPTVA